MSKLPLSCTSLLLTGLLCGCQQEITAELAGSALDGSSAVVVQLSSVQLLKSDGSTVTLSLTAGVGEDVDVVSLQDGTTLQLLSETDDFDGDYVGVRPVFASTGNFVRETDGSEVSLDLLSQTDYVDIEFSLERRESVSLVLQLTLPFSVIRPETDGQDYGLRPAVRAALRDEAGGLEGAIDLSLLTTEDCQAGRDTGDGVAVYLFAGSNRTPVDYFASDSYTITNQPVALAPAFFDGATDTWRYRFDVVQAGDYTAALTCQADAENPSEQDGLDFVQDANVTISDGSDGEQDFTDD